jgi:hypothetical protein
MWGDMDRNTTHLVVPVWFHTSQLVLHAIYRVSDKQLFCDWGRQIKPFFFFSWWYRNLALMGDGEVDDVDKGKSNFKKVNVTLDMKIVKHERMAILYI